jgi:acetyltransferase-like isoleucine patch superfamily enzyme
MKSLRILIISPTSLRIHDSAFVTIGNRVLIAPNVTILTERHDKDVQSRRDGVVYARPVTIGDDCWIGAGATILPGVTIGNGTTIGAGSVVTKDIPSFSVAWGVPARVIHGVDDPDAADAAQYRASQHL